jgi:hypothetical protein
MKAVWGLIGVLALVQPVSAEIYHYVDERGRKVYVDRQSQIPPQFRDQVQTRQEESNTLSKSERERRALVLERIETQSEAQAEIGRIEAEMQTLEQRASIEGNSVKVPVVMRYLGRTLTLNLIVDTGATRTLLHRNAIAGFNAVPRPAGYATVVGGARIPTSVMTINQMTFGPVERNGAEVLVIDAQPGIGYDGLLGMDVLSTVKYEIDLQRGVMIWEADRYRELVRARDTLLARIETDLAQP